jgi:SAM-dependent methyltransferase
LLDRRNEPLPTGICLDCGLISHFQLPSDDELQRYYRDEYRLAYHAESTPSPRRVVKAWRYGQKLLKLLRPHLRANDRVFEIGAGLGCTVKAFELAGYAASGIEPGTAFSGFSREALQASILTARLENLPRRASYDFVLLAHVIEHFNSPRRALRHIRSLVNQDGRLYVECPNIAASHAAPGRMFHYAHVYNFTHHTLVAMAQACGFELLEILSPPGDRYMRMLFVAGQPREPVIGPDSFAAAMAGVTRYNLLTYHLRTRYLLQRARSLSHEIRCRLRARHQLQQIVATCQRHAAATASRPESWSLTKAA